MLSYSKCSYRIGGGPWGWCDLPSEWNVRGTVKHKILVLGNSYAANQGRVVYEMCRNPETEIKIFAMAGCEVFSTTREFWHCHNSSKVYMEAIKEYKPDVLFILVRYIHALEIPSPTNELMIGRMAKEAAEVLRSFSRYVSSNIFVQHAIPRPVLGFEWQCQQAVLREQIVDSATVVNKSVNVGLARELLERSIQNCSKCTMIDYSPVFTINETFQFFDNDARILNFNGYFHFTPFGLHKLRPYYKNICSNITYPGK
ncbi:hypothetical protein V3C99_006268 [Haemonchus contortus]